MTAPAEPRDPLDVVAEEFLDRYRHGERPALSEFVARHPELAHQICDLFPTLVELEHVGSASGTHRIPQPSGFQCPDRLGDFCIVREVGRGGMGIVYEAQQESLGRRVALKVFPFHALLDPKHLARFQREARAAAQLHHSHIVPVFGVGQCDGLYFYAMQFINGQSLDLVIRGIAELASGRPESPPCDPNFWPLSKDPQGDIAAGFDETKPHVKSDTEPNHSLGASLVGRRGHEYYRRISQLALQAAEALAYAHSQGIVHRDIKPSNLLLDTTGDVWITDFGLAKHDGPSELTQSGDVIGTLRYMAPEQLQGWADPRTDIHGLGLTLYELLSLRPAYDATTRGELIRQISDRTPAPLSRWDRDVSRDLETIVGKMIAKEPAERYSSAADAATDLRRFISDQPIVARRASAWERMRRTCRKHPAVALLTTLVFALLVFVASISAATSWKVRASLAAVSEAKRERTDQLWKSKLNEALSLRYSGRAGHRVEAWKRLSEAVALAREVGAGEEARRDLRNAAISTLALTDLQFDKPGPIPPVGTSILGFDPTLIKYFRADEAFNISVRRVDDDLEVASLPSRDLGFDSSGISVHGCSSDGRLLALAYFPRPNNGFHHIVVWDLNLQVVVFKSAIQNIISLFDMSDDGRLLVAVGRDALVHIYDIASGKETGRFKLPGLPDAISLNTDGTQLAASQCPTNNVVTVFDVPTGVVLHRFQHTDWVHRTAWHPAGKLLAVTVNDFLVHIWNLDTGREQCVTRGHQALPHYPSFTPDGEVLVTGTYDGTVRLWNAWTGNELVRCPGTMGSILSADGKLLAVRQGKRYVFYNVLRSEEYRSLPITAITPSERFHCSPAAQHPTANWLPVIGWDGIRLLDASTGKQLASKAGRVTGFEWSADGKSLFASLESRLERWAITENEDAYTIGPPQNIGSHYSEIRVHPTGQQLVAVSKSFPHQLDMKTKPVTSHKLDHPNPMGLAYSADGRWLAVGNHHGAGLKVWRVGESEHAALLIPECTRTYPSFSPDSRILATTVDGMVRMWSVGDWTPLRSATTVGGYFPAFSFSPDGRLLAYTRTPYEICLENLETGQQVAILEAPDDLQISKVLFDHKGGKLIVSSSYPHATRVWDLRLLDKQLASIGLSEGFPQLQTPPATVETARPKRVFFDEGLTTKELEQRADGYRVRQQFDQACADFELIVLKEPDNHRILNRLAWLRCVGPSSVRNPIRAEPLARRACELDPKSQFYQNTLALVHLRLGQHVEAMSAIERSRQLANGQSNALMPFWGFERALAQFQSGQQEEARKTFEETKRWLANNRSKLVNPHLFEAEALESEAEVALDVVAKVGVYPRTVSQ